MAEAEKATRLARFVTEYEQALAPSRGIVGCALGIPQSDGQALGLLVWVDPDHEGAAEGARTALPESYEGYPVFIEEMEAVTLD